MERMIMYGVIGAASMVLVRGLGGSVAAGLALGILITTVIAVVSNQ